MTPPCELCVFGWDVHTRPEGRVGQRVRARWLVELDLFVVRFPYVVQQCYSFGSYFTDNFEPPSRNRIEVSSLTLRAFFNEGKEPSRRSQASLISNPFARLIVRVSVDIILLKVSGVDGGGAGGGGGVRQRNGARALALRAVPTPARHVDRHAKPFGWRVDDLIASARRALDRRRESVPGDGGVARFPRPARRRLRDVGSDELGAVPEIHQSRIWGAQLQRNRDERLVRFRFAGVQNRQVPDAVEGAEDHAGLERDEVAPGESEVRTDRGFADHGTERDGAVAVSSTPRLRDSIGPLAAMRTRSVGPSGNATVPLMQPNRQGKPYILASEPTYPYGSRPEPLHLRQVRSGLPRLAAWVVPSMMWGACPVRTTTAATAVTSDASRSGWAGRRRCGRPLSTSSVPSGLCGLETPSGRRSVTP